MNLFKTLKKVNEENSHRMVLFFNFCLTNIVKGKTRTFHVNNFVKMYRCEPDEIKFFIQKYNGVFGINEQTNLVIDITDSTVTFKTEKVVPKTPDYELEEATIDHVINTLNNVTGKGFRLKTKSHRSHIRARIREGFKIPDFEHVIRLKAMEWLDTAQNLYLRPETLFGTKMDGYVNQQLSASNEPKLNAINRAIHEAINK